MRWLYTLSSVSASLLIFIWVMSVSPTSHNRHIALPKTATYRKSGAVTGYVAFLKSYR